MLILYLGDFAGKITAVLYQQNILSHIPGCFTTALDLGKEVAYLLTSAHLLLLLFLQL